MIALCLILGLAAGPVAPPAADDTVVARVEGPRGAFSITLGRLVAFAATQPERTPRESLDALIDFELLAAEADAAGLATHALVRLAAAQAMVARFLTDDFEPRWQPDRLPEAIVRDSYQRNRSFFQHPELREADHLIVTTKSSQRPEDPALDGRFADLARRIQADVAADPPPDAASFRLRADRWQTAATEIGAIVRAENLRRFARKGRYHTDFTDQVFALSAPGDVTPAFPTPYGWHVARLDRIVPAERRSFEEVEPELRVRIAPEVRTVQFIRFTDGLAAALPPLRNAPGAQALTNPEPIAEVELRRGRITVPPASPAPPAPPAPPQ